MYKIAQNFPVIVKQPLFLKSTNLLKSQGSLFLCSKVKLHENDNEFETEVSKSETIVSNKKEPGKNIEVNTPPVIYLSESPTSSYPLDDFQFNVHTSSPYQTDPNVSNKIETKYDVIILHDKNHDSSKENYDENISEKPSNSVLHHTELSNNDVKNEAVAELNQEPNKKENKKWNWKMYKNKSQAKNQNISSPEPIIFIGDSQENNEQKLENVFTQSNPESSILPSPQTESSTSNNNPHLLQLEPFKTEILSSNAVKSTKTEWKTPFSEKLKAFTPPSKNNRAKHNYNVFVQDHRTEIKQKKPLITNSNNLQFKEAQPIAKIRAHNPIRAQNIVKFKGKPAQIPINPNISFTNPVIATIRENRLVNPKTGKSFYKKMASDPILKPKTNQSKINSGDATQINDTKFNITSIPQKKDTMETKIPSFFPSNPETSKVPKSTKAHNVDNFYTNLFSASSINPTTLSNETVSASESSKIATPAASINKSATGAASSRILANTTSLNKNFTASIDPFSKTIPNVSPIEKQIPIATLANKTINLTPFSKTKSPEASPSQQHTNTLKLSPPSQDVPSQNTIKPTSSGGVQFQIPGRLLIAFTCKKCNTRNSKKISKHAYTKGVVIIRCDGCKNNHLIADNLNWFSDMGKKRNIEDIMAEKGEKVTKIVLPGGISEFLTDS